MTQTVADALAGALVAAGFRRCFGYLGYMVDQLSQALPRAGCEVVIAASETGAGYMAQGLALVSARPALTFCSGGPGLAMLLPALQVARLDGIPLLAVVGQTGNNGLPTFQNTGPAGSRDRELLAALRITTLHLQTPADLPAILQAAWDRLKEGAPVVLSAPCDVLATPWFGPKDAAQGAPPWSLRDPMAAGRSSQALPCDEAIPGTSRTGGYRAVVAELLDHLPAHTLWFGDAGQTRHAMGIELGRRGVPFFESASSGPMGWALAAAIGAASHDAASPICCFTGDGSALMLANEWTTAVKLHLPITYVLADNGALGQPFGRLRASGAENLARLPVVDWTALAAALGMPARRIDENLTLGDGLAALPPSGPRLLVVPLPERDPAVKPPYSLTLGSPIAHGR
ncbi:thiamine pyrophosphate-binding protein [Cyanobium sp. FGCU-6]|nr:thiamine pyrophosphate-binding protein [Cyanobium sp. FGCU6]